MITHLEEPLPAGGSCLLGAINLASLVKKEFQEGAEFNFKEFKRVVREGVKYLNEVLEEGLPLHPLEKQRKSVRKWRQIGLGIMGLGDMLIKMGIKYGSQKAIDLSRMIGRVMINEALKQSARIANDKGTFPAYDEKATLESPFLKKVADDDTIDLIKQYGLRNSQLLTIAPTGSISNICQVSGGIEPIFKKSYKRKTQSLHGEDEEYIVHPPVITELMEVKGIEDKDNLPDYVVDAHQLNYEERIKMQSAWQEYIDASISSTINIDNETSVEEVKDLYIMAWKKELKGVTVFRDGCAREGILKGVDLDDMEDKKTEMEAQDFIDAGICPECKANLQHANGCMTCKSCGWDKCST